MVTLKAYPMRNETEILGKAKEGTEKVRRTDAVPSKTKKEGKRKKRYMNE